MSLVRPSIPRGFAMAVLIGLCVLLPAAAAAAHEGLGGPSSDYRIEITGWDGDHSGIEMRVIELGSRLELRRTTATSVLVLGYEGEPYLRLDASGVAENTNSPAHYLNRDRFASANPPASASASAEPAWVQVDTGSTARWHDHRAHWMSTTPRADVLADPDVERVIFERNPIELVVDGREVSALIRVTWLPAPRRLVWLAVAAAGALAVAAAFVLVPAARRLLPVATLTGSVAGLVGQGPGMTRVVLAGAAILIAVASIALRRPLLGAGAAALTGLLGATRLEVYEHELLAGWASGDVQRVAVAVALACGVGVLAVAIVGVVEPSRSVPAAGPAALAESPRPAA